MILSEPAQWTIAITLFTVPFIAYGGHFIRTLIGNPRTSEQMAYFRAGHGHAGILVVLSIIGQVVADSINVSESVESVIRTLIAIPPIFFPLGFFLGAPGPDGKPGRLMPLIYVGALSLSIGTVALGIALLTT